VDEPEADVPADELTHRERAALLVLLAEGREMTNADLREVAGFTLDGQPRRRLVDDRLITAEKRGRRYCFEITDDGAKRCRTELDAPLPARAGYLGGALHAVLAALGRHDAPLSELLVPRPTAEPAGGEAGSAEADVERAVRAAYRDAPRTADGWAGLTGLRERLGGRPRAEVDAALARLASRPGVHLQPEPHQARLTDADRADAVLVGGTERHMIKIEAG
jgi:hypothetical protein